MLLKTAIASAAVLLKGYLLKQANPLNVVLTTNTSCNFKCRYCKIWGRDDTELTTSQIEDLIEQLAVLGTQRLGLTGGEPLLRDDIGHIIQFAKSRGIFVSLNTNGSLVEARISALKGLDLLILSFDGEEEVHNFQKKEDAYQHVMNAIKVAKRNNIKVATTTTLTCKNLHSVDFIIYKAGEMGFKAAFQLLHHPQAAAGDTSDFMPAPEDYRQTLKRLSSLKKKYPRIILNSRRYFEILYNWPDYEKTILEKSPFRLKCWSGKFYCHIDVNGDVYPCHQLLKNIKVSNILTTSLSDSLNTLDYTPCSVCLAGDYLEYNLLFSLNPSALKNLIHAEF